MRLGRRDSPALPPVARRPPYIGGHWTRKVSDTADLARSRGEDVKEFGIVAGLRI